MDSRNRVNPVERVYSTASDFRRGLREQTEAGQKEKEKKEEKKKQEKQEVRQRDFVDILKTEYKRKDKGFGR